MKIANVPLEEYGDTMKIVGVIVGDGHKTRALYLPGEHATVFTEVAELTVNEALAWLKQSDDPTAPIYGDNGFIKAVVRKAKRQVDQNVAWMCYGRAGYACEYCSKINAPLTYDHWLAQAFGGETTLDNGVSSCRPCNKAKGHMTQDEWMSFMRSHDFKYSARIADLYTANVID